MRDILFLETVMNGLLETAIQAALKAGEKISEIYHDPKADFEVKLKADCSPLTIADKKANEVIVEQLGKTPYPIISEECKTMDYAERRKWTTVWIVDPLDGTKEFIKRNGEFTVNIALVYEGKPALGVVYIPERKTLYYGTIREGAWKVEDVDAENGADFAAMERRAVRLPIARQEKGFVAVASRSHRNPETEVFLERLRQEHGEVQLVSMGSSIKICLVAEGTADIYPRFAPTMEWDTAAGHAIAKAAGKEMYHEDGVTPLTYNKEDLRNPWFIVK